MSKDKLPFFDADQVRGGRVGPDVSSKSGRGSSGRPMSVSALVARIKSALADAFPKRVAVVAELSNVKLHSSGHLYFSLKDANAAIDAVMWRSGAQRLKFQPTDGLEVVAEGRVDLYDVRGELQLYVEKLTPKGAGALELAFRQLREKLAAEGLFDPSRKKPIPAFPRAIGVVTSPTGAAIRDIRRTLARRWCAAKVYLMPALVQGDQAAADIASAVSLLDANAARLEIDTIIVARGGGSLEDLWAFNTEPVARAISAAQTAIISGVGHEADVTISDMVADARAATPTAAAELATPDKAEMARAVELLARRLTRTVTAHYRTADAALSAVLRSVVFRDPFARLRTQTQRLDEIAHRLPAALAGQLAEKRRSLESPAAMLAAGHPARMLEQARARRQKLLDELRWALGARSKRLSDRLAGIEGRLLAAHPQRRLGMASQRLGGIERHLHAMGYRNVLNRGFSITRGAGGEILHSPGQVRLGQRIKTELADGKLTSTVESGGQRPVGKPRGKNTKPDNPTLFD